MQDKTKCNHEYFINEDNQSECKHCGLLESTIKECYPNNNMNYIDKDKLIKNYTDEVFEYNRMVSNNSVSDMDFGLFIGVVFLFIILSMLIIFI